MGRLTPRERTGLLVGVLAMFLALDVAFLVSLVGLPSRRSRSARRSSTFSQVGSRSR